VAPENLVLPSGAPVIGSGGYYAISSSLSIDAVSKINYNKANMTKRTIVRGLIFFGSLVIGIGIFGFLIWKEGWNNIISSLVDFGIWPFVGFVTLSFINFGLYSWRWQLIINSHLEKKDRVPLWRVYFHRMAGFATSYLTPAAQVGGEPVRIGMLMSDGVPGREATSSVLLDVALELFVYISFIVVGVLLAMYEGLADGISLEVMGVALILALVLIASFFIAMAKGNGYFSKLFRTLKLGRFKKLRKVEALIVETEELMTGFLKTSIWRQILILILAIIVIGFRVFEVFYIAHFFGVALTFGQAFLIGTLPGIALLMPIPASLGIFEGGFAAVFVLLGVPLTAVGFALIIRLRDTLFILIGTTHAIRQGGILINSRFDKNKRGK